MVADQRVPRVSTVERSATTIRNEYGDKIKLSNIWKERIAVIVFLRHFGCRFCKEMASAFNSPQIREPLKNANVGLVFLAIGLPDHIPRFKKEIGLPDDQEVYVDVDPDAPETYDLFNLKQGVDVITRGTIALAPKIEAMGWTDGGYESQGKKYVGDIGQLGGVFVLGPGNNCDYAFRSQYVGDAPDLDDVLTAAKASAITSEGGESSYVFPSTAQWVEKLKLTTLSSRRTASGISLSYISDEVTKPVRPLGELLEDEYEEIDVDSQKPSESTSVQGGPKELFPIVVAVIALLAIAALGAGIFMDEQLEGLLSGWELLLEAEEISLFFTALTTVFVVVVVFHFWMSRKDVKMVAEVEPERPRRKTTQDTAVSVCGPELEILSVRQVDDEAYDLGLLKCDCGPEDLDKRRRDSDATVPLSLEELMAIIKQSGGDVDDQELVTPRTPRPKPQCHDPEREKKLQVLLSLSCYFREFLAKPHPLLGRPGTTCPFVPSSLKMNCLYSTVVNTSSIDFSTPETTEIDLEVVRDEIEEAVRAGHKAFGALEPQNGRKAQYKSLVIAFPDVPLKVAHKAIDHVQARLKKLFVPEGLMVGEFHLNNNSAGLHNENFFPLRTPIPSIAIRYMVPSDVVFMANDDAATRCHYLESYIKNFSEKMLKKSDPRTVDELEKANKMLADIKGGMARCPFSGAASA